MTCNILYSMLCYVINQYRDKTMIKINNLFIATLIVLSLNACYGSKSSNFISPEGSAMETQIHKLDAGVFFFGFDKYDVSDFSSEQKMKLVNLVELLHDHDGLHIVLSGHTDEKGSPEYNIALGERRANAIKQYMLHEGVSAERIKVVSYGKSQLLSHDNHEKNRRVVVSVA